MTELSPVPSSEQGRGSQDDDRIHVRAGLLHDLSNMLAVVLGSLELLRRRSLDQPARKQADRAQWGAWRASQLTHQMLAVAKGDADSEDGEATVVDLNRAVSAFAAMIGPNPDGGARFSLRLAPGPLPVRLDVKRLELALVNLVRNAADATERNGKVVVSTAGRRMDGLGEDQPTVEVAVSDTGTGMAPDTARRVTDAFFTTKDRERGTGLGLWMVRRFAEDAGGKVEIETELGRGTTIRVVLPRGEPE